MQKRVCTFTSELKLAKAKALDASAPPASVESGEGDTGAEFAVTKRLDELDGFLKQLVGVDTPEVAQLVAQYKAEQVKLRAQLFQAKQAQQVALQAEFASQEAVLAESRKQLLELESQRAQLYGALPQAPTGPPGADAGNDQSSWTLPKLEQVLLAAGTAPDLQQEVAAVVGKIRQHRQTQEERAQAQREANEKQAAEAAAQAATEQQDAAMAGDADEVQGVASVDQANAEELRDYLRDSGAEFPNAAEASEDELRAAVKRLRLARPKWK
ncbi:unnamed protein product, partial [Prorocentrum cordatum]